jgi:hypothetical protein
MKHLLPQRARIVGFRCPRAWENLVSLRRPGRAASLLGTPQSRDLFLEVMQRVRRRYRFVVVGYVVMPAHEAALHGSQSRCPGLGADAGTVELEQLPSLRFGRAGISAGQRSIQSGEERARNYIV